MLLAFGKSRIIELEIIHRKTKGGIVMRGKIAKIILGFTVVLALFLGGSSAKAEDDSQTTSEGLKVQCDYYAKQAMITGHSGSPTVVNIPEEFDGCEVIGIGKYAFSNSGTLETVNIPKTVTKIADGAFSDCSRLNKVTIASECNISELGEYVFKNCKNLSEITLPANGFKIIGTGAFECCSSIASFSFGINTQKIERSAFWGCDKLKSIVIPNSVTVIGTETFGNCNNLEKVYILSKNISISEYAFKRNSKLTVFGFAGSGAEQCAKAAGLNFTSITGPELTYKENKKHEIELSWSDVANVAQYDVYRSTMENGEYSLLESLGSNVLSYTDTSVERGKKYFYYVSAKTTIEDGTILDIPSAVVSAATKEVTLKVSREKVTVNYSTSVTISYLEEEGNVEYEVDNPAIASAEWIGDFYGNDTKLKITGLKKGKTSITISNSENEDTVTIDVIVNKATVKVSQVKGTSWKKKSIRHQAGDGLTYIFSWKKVSGASGYEVKIYEKETPYDSWYSFTKKTKKANTSVSFSYLYRLKAKVRAYKVVDGKKFYGKWSTMKTAKIRY